MKKCKGCIHDRVDRLGDYCSSDNGCIKEGVEHTEEVFVRNEKVLIKKLEKRIEYLEKRIEEISNQ